MTSDDLVLADSHKVIMVVMEDAVCRYINTYIHTYIHTYIQIDSLLGLAAVVIFLRDL